MNEDILEKLAEVEHEQWCDWAGSLSAEMDALLQIISKLQDNCDSLLSDDELSQIEDSKDRLIRWNSLMVLYSELSEEMKESDRVYARKVLSVFEKYR